MTWTKTSPRQRPKRGDTQDKPKLATLPPLEMGKVEMGGR